jgi:hypothetical protein
VDQLDRQSRRFLRFVVCRRYERPDRRLRGGTLWARFAQSDRCNRLRAVSTHSKSRAVGGGRGARRMIRIARAGSARKSMSGLGQNAKYSLRADVFCLASHNGHCPTPPACPKRACQQRTYETHFAIKDLDGRQNAVNDLPEIVPHLMAMPVLMRNNFYIDRQLAANMPVFDRKDEFYKPFAPLVYVH